MGYTCHLCTYSTTRKSNFERHLESHDDMAKTKDVYSNVPSFSENSQNNLTKIDLRLVPKEVGDNDLKLGISPIVPSGGSN